MSITLVQGDTAPVLRGVITNDDVGTPLNLSNCQVYFQMRKKDDLRYTINAAATITSAAAGKVSYSIAANDLNTPGEYQGQFEVHYLDTTIQTTQNIVTINVRRQ